MLEVVVAHEHVRDFLLVVVGDDVAERVEFLTDQFKVACVEHVDRGRAVERLHEKRVVVGFDAAECDADAARSHC